MAGTAAITTVSDDLALVRLMAWLSPVFPTGGFAYSSGLEAAVREGHVTDQVALVDWIGTLLSLGRLRNDAIFLAEALRHWNELDALDEINELAGASAGSEQLHRETNAQGRAFIQALESWELSEEIKFPADCSLPVAVGTACGAAGIAERQSVLAYIHAFVSNQAQIAIRLSVCGQTGAARLLADLEPTILSLAAETEKATLDDLGSASTMADLMAMRHETQHGRLFRS